MVTKVTSNVIDPAAVTATAVGLGSVDNTADAAKPISTAQQTALNLKANLASPTFTGTVGGITKAMVGLGSVDNTADAAKNVLYAAAAGTSGACSGNAATSTTSVGYNQTWQVVTRTHGTTYTNSTGKPIVLTCSSVLGNGTHDITVAGVLVIQSIDTAGSGIPISAIIPIGATYVVNGTGSENWVELR